MVLKIWAWGNRAVISRTRARGLGLALRGLGRYDEMGATGRSATSTEEDTT